MNTIVQFLEHYAIWTFLYFLPLTLVLILAYLVTLLLRKFFPKNPNIPRELKPRITPQTLEEKRTAVHKLNFRIRFTFRLVIVLLIITMILLFFYAFYFEIE
ncbi:MAG: hypothetical protein SFU98_12875 [Leptospiraceae bacterium]|nr:hypothetical protein [Leptospiraceae bacterium]